VIENATRKVRVSPEVMDNWCTYDAHGNRMRIDWGKPGADGFYDPTVTTDSTDNIRTAALQALRELVQALPPACHSRSGLNCEADAYGWCYLIDRGAVLDAIATLEVGQ